MSAAITDPAGVDTLPSSPPNLHRLHFEWMVAAYEMGLADGAGHGSPVMDEDTAMIVANVRTEARRKMRARAEEITCTT